MIGLATNNAKANFNNVVVTVPVAAPTWNYQTNFNNSPAYLDTPTGGTWSVSRYGYTGIAPTGGFGIAPIDLGLAIGAAPGTFTLQPGSTIDISTVVQVGGSAGITFDNVNGGFRFAALISSIPSNLTYAAGLSPMKAGTEYVVLGHYSASSGFVIDSYQAYTFNNRFNQSATLDVIVDRDVVNVDVNNCLVLTTTYSGAVNGFGFGLLSWTGTNLFNSLCVTTNDPNMARPFTPNSLQQPQPQGTTWSYNTSFGYGPVYYDAPIGGTWSYVQGNPWFNTPSGYQGVAPANGLGIVTLDPALAFGLPAGALTFQSSSTVSLQATLSAIGGSAGLVFDTSRPTVRSTSPHSSTDPSKSCSDTTPLPAASSSTRPSTTRSRATPQSDARHRDGRQPGQRLHQQPAGAERDLLGRRERRTIWASLLDRHDVFKNCQLQHQRSGTLWSGGLAASDFGKARPLHLDLHDQFPTQLRDVSRRARERDLDDRQAGLAANGAPPSGGVGIYVIDPGLALNLPAGTYTLPDGSAVQITVQISQFGGAAGVVFDQT